MKIFLIIFSLLFFSCSMPDRDNSFDPESEEYCENCDYSSNSSSDYYSSSDYDLFYSSSSSETVFSTFCNGVNYNPEIQFCYKNIIYPACNGEAYIPFEQKCEEEIIVTKCGENYYISETHFCSKSEIYELCDGKEYNPVSNRCENNIILDSKCKDNFYNSETHFCSSNTIYEKCYGEAYTPTTHVCVENEIFPKCGDDYYNLETHFCSSNTIYEKCGGEVYNPTNQKCKDKIILYKCGNNFYNSKTHFCYGSGIDAGIFEKCDGEKYTPTTHGCLENVITTQCGNIFYNSETHFCFFKDNKVYEKCGGIEHVPDASGICSNGKLVFDYNYLDYGGQTYKTIVIGTQTWMAENLNYEIIGTRCYEDKPENCEVFGFMYDWETAKNICPTGWHLPNDNEWNTLKNFVGSNSGTKLKANSSLWVSGKGTDDYGFTALPGGLYDSGFKQMRSTTAFWSATKGSIAGSAHSHTLSYNSTSLGLLGLYTNSTLAYVRCIKD